MAEASTQPKPFAFVLMPFDAAFNDVYHLGIKPACADAGAYCERVDEQKYDETILERIYNQIAKADMLVADMTGRNPNVFYEVGYAHALGKRVILLTQRADDIPFDLKQHTHVVYGGSITTLKAELIKWVRWAIENPKGVSLQPGSTLECFVNGEALIDNPLIEAELGSDFLRLQFDLVNSPVHRVRAAHFQAGLYAPSAFGDSLWFPLDITGQNALGLAFPDSSGMTLFLLQHQWDLLPGERRKFWAQFPAGALLKDAQANSRDVYDLELRILSEAAPVDYPFRVKLK
jgi:Nucleoside 2-deoxyribosyltransferase